MKYHSFIYINFYYVLCLIFVGKYAVVFKPVPRRFSFLYFTIPALAAQGGDRAPRWGQRKSAGVGPALEQGQAKLFSGQ